jgi:N-dimethylarginine dimethylaminohydrolase
MPEPRLYRPDDFRFAIADLAPREEPREVLLCDPAYYRIEESLNPHMVEDGRLRKVDLRAAYAQWEALGETYARLGVPVHVLPAARGLADMVFAANQTLPFLDAAGRRAVVPSRMRAASRRGEVPHYVRWFVERGYAVRALDLPEGETLEGGGDCLHVPGRRALLAGIGPRTTEGALRALAPLVEMPVVALRLVDERFYHLDTCLMPLGTRCALVVREALAADALALVERLFEDPIAVPPAEADSPGFACNAHSPDGRRVIIQRGNPKTVAALAARGFEPIEVDVSEFVKAGGAVYCLKMMVW